jgi:transcription elongation factor GreB
MAVDGKKRYITRDGYDRLAKELDKLWRIDRRKVVAEVADAAALGDRSENAEYIYGKRKLREIDRRVRWLKKTLEEVTVVVPGAQPNKDKVYFGAWVTVEDEDGEESEYQIVGEDEVDPPRRITIHSPLGKALLGREEGDSFVFARPKGRAELTVVKIRYE